MKSQTKFICEHPGCHKEYSTKFALRRHVYSHSGVKAFACNQCSKRFALEQYLTEHMFVHTKAKPFVCGIGGCPEAFRQRGKLCLHRMTHKEYKKKAYRVFARKKPAQREPQPVQESAPDLSQYCLCDYMVPVQAWGYSTLPTVPVFFPTVLPC